MYVNIAHTLRLPIQFAHNILVLRSAMIYVYMIWLSSPTVDLKIINKSHWLMGKRRLWKSERDTGYSWNVALMARDKRIYTWFAHELGVHLFTLILFSFLICNK